jgi:Domain of unknown function (DUF5597)/Beta-galactosidase
MYKTFLSVIACAWMVAAAGAAQAERPIPRLEHRDGRHALIVDGKPFLILGAQSNNSSAWPAVLPKVWSAMQELSVNTLEIPIYWEQFEPEPGKYDYSTVDTIIEGARERDLRLVLLWFGTWKNGSNHYMPEWMKRQPRKYPNMIDASGKEIDSPSPHTQATLDADIKAFSALISHLKAFDAERTVIMIQVENEPGTWNSVRDHSSIAQRAFDAPAPAAALVAMNKPAKPARNWAAAFGADADEFFHVWHVASFIGKVAAAGKSIYPLPMLVNASIRNPLSPGPPTSYQVGGPNDNVFPLWKAAAPAVDILSPDIYLSNTEAYLKALDLYNRPDNPLFVPETIGHGALTRFLFAAIGRGAIGYAPFGMDDTRVWFEPQGKSFAHEDFYRDTALNYRMLKPMARQIAALSFAGKVQTAIQMDDSNKREPGSPFDRVNYVTDQTLHFEGWDVDVAFGTFSRLARSASQPKEPDGRILVAELSKGTFLVAGYHCRVMMRPTGDRKGRPWGYLKVEEGGYVDEVFKPERVLNGDQTDWGLVFSSPTVLRVTPYVR